MFVKTKKRVINLDHVSSVVRVPGAGDEVSFRVHTISDSFAIDEEDGEALEMILKPVGVVEAATATKPLVLADDQDAIAAEAHSEK